MVDRQLKANKFVLLIRAVIKKRKLFPRHPTMIDILFRYRLCYKSYDFRIRLAGNTNPIPFRADQKQS